MGWLTRWRRARVLQQDRLDAQDWADCIARFSFLRALDAAERDRLRGLVLQFLAEKSVDGAGGLAVTAAMRLQIAAQACLLVLNLDLDCYRDWVGVIVYPDEFMAEYEVTDEDGVVHRVRAPLSGEAWEQGPVILSWQDAAAADGGFGYNVVMHEFAHKIDMLNGAADGFPPLHAGMVREEWTQSFAAAYADLERRVAAGEDTLVDPYAAEDPGEFFAVMTELFFEMPRDLRRHYPAVYGQLAAFYRQDPAVRSLEVAA